MTEHNDSLVAALREMAACLPPEDGRKDTLNSAIYAIQRLADANDTFANTHKENQSLKQKLESMERNYGAIKERVDSFNHDEGVRRLREQLTNSERALEDERKKCSELARQQGDLERQLDQAMSAARNLASAVVNQSKMLAKLADRV